MDKTKVKPFWDWWILRCYIPERTPEEIWNDPEVQKIIQIHNNNTKKGDLP